MYRFNPIRGNDTIYQTRIGAVIHDHFQAIGKLWCEPNAPYAGKAASAIFFISTPLLLPITYGLSFIGDAMEELPNDQSLDVPVPNQNLSKLSL